MKPSKPISILIVDDDPLILFTLEKVVAKQHDLHLVGSATNGQDALVFLQDKYQPDVVLLDIEMPIMNGIECLQQIRKLYPAICVILLTTFSEEQYIVEGLASGARSYLLKTTTYDELGHYIREVLNNTFVMPTEIAIKLATFLHTKKEFSEKSLSTLFFQTYELTRSEQQIVKLLAKRFSTIEIAEELVIQVGTVKNHLVTIFKKLHVQNRQEAIDFIETHLM